MRAVRPATLCATVLGVIAALVVPAGPAMADDIRNEQWWVKTLDLDAVHQITQGEGIIVAVIDTGVDANHPDLKGNVLPGVDIADPKTKGQVDRNGHGTAMASLIAGHGHGPGNRDGIIGIAPKAKILPINVEAKSKIIPPKAIAAGIDGAVAHGANVINVSLGAADDDDIAKAVERAYDNNVIVVAATGNESDAGSLVVESPANQPGAMAVAGIKQDGSPSKENTKSPKTAITAPGEDIIVAQPNGRYATSTGSSDATAIVSGAVALVRAKYPKLSSYQMFKRVLETTKDAGKPGHDEVFGWGTLDLKNALTGQPDGRNNKKAEATTEPPIPSYAQDDDDDRGPPVLVITAILWSVILLVLGGLAFLIVRTVRRKRRDKEAAAAVPMGDAVGTGPPPNSTFAPPPSVPAGPPPVQEDDSVWRPPTV
ncbi:type VII secretion-associated serine protease mycosin [Krasilnikovia sp. MM14-A1259]|uniref:type VII secretion-associated serine protease mycosin n=1 Tax=Krasilnikovia sp. MM14-A1259 TaxID=3373539 RepID=UPI0037FD07A9